MSHYIRINDLTQYSGVEDMSKEEATDVLIQRYERRPNGSPYTNIGDRILVSLNPYESTELQSDTTAQGYVDDYRSTSIDRKELPPHVFKIAEMSYLHMRRTGLSQSIVFVGPSGSGKTEQYRLSLRFFSLIRTQSKKDTRIYNRIQNANIVLEAFSHAKTTVHNNASRVSTYAELQFDSRGRTIGMKMLTYLLEKSRVTGVPQDERNFHVFHYLTNGAVSEDRESYGLSQSSYEYLNRPGTVQRIQGFSDSERFSELLGAMREVGLNQKYQRHIFNTLSAVLTLGNIQFQQQKQGEETSTTVRNQDAFDHASSLLGLDSETLLSLLTIQTKQVGSDKYTVYLDGSNTAARRDDLARSLYSLLFNWVVEFLNSKLCRHEADCASFISLVDFPGWSTSRHNGYEQLCTNYANERLHHFLFHQVFEAGNPEYVSEGIASAVPMLEFPDRTLCLDLFMKPKSGLFATMDWQAAEYLRLTKNAKKSAKRDDPEEHEFDPNLDKHAASAQLLSVFKKLHNDRTGDGNAYYSAGESKNEMNCFTVSHFWGDVSYNVDEFVEKNLDQLSSDFVAVFRGDGTIENPGTRNGFISGLFSSKTLTTESHPQNERTVVQAQARAVPTRTPTMMRSKSKHSTRQQKVVCVATQFQRALNEMIGTIDDTLSWFVLCMKPNDQRRPRETDSRRILAQVSLFDLDDVARRKKVEFAAILTIPDFCSRYNTLFNDFVLNHSDASDDKSKCIGLKEALQLSDTEMVIGSSKVFLSFAAWRRIDDPIREIERQEQNEKRRVRGEAKVQQQQQLYDDQTAYGDTIGASAASFASQSEANLIYNAQPMGLQTNAETAFGDSIPAQQARALKGRVLGASGNAQSYYSDDDGYQDITTRDGMSDVMTERNYNHGFPGSAYNAASQANSIKKEIATAGELETSDDSSSDKPVTRRRKCWVGLVWACTWMVPSRFLDLCGRLRRRDQRMAWREKVTLCMIIFWSCAFVIFWIVGLGLILCPKQHVYSSQELREHNKENDALISIRGEVFDVKDFNHMNVDFDYLLDHDSQLLGQDLSHIFPLQLSFVCPFDNIDPRLSMEDKPDLYSYAYYHDHRWWRHPTDKGYNYYQFRLMRVMRENHAKGHIAYDPKELKKAGSGNSKLDKNKKMFRCIIHDQVYDLTDYIESDGARYVVSPDGMSNSTNGVNRDFLDSNVVDMFRDNAGEDISDKWDRYFADKASSRSLHSRCLRGAFYAGRVDIRKSSRCYAANYLLLSGSIALVAIIAIKFVAALQFSSSREPEPGENFVICNVPCYTEGEDSLQNTIDSLAKLRYDDKRKLIFIVCDGMIMGSGNDRPTPRIVLDILGVDRDQEPEALSYIALGEGSKEHNMAKVYSGLYEIAGHVVPYMVIVKCGIPQERTRPGNRGKRDSQIMLMRFFNKVYFDLPMTPLELEMYHQIKNVIGVNPALYEFVLMIDADTIVYPDSLNRLINSMNHDTKIIGICGETMLKNAKSSWTTMIQVYEYFISHHLTKAFESLFGSVTCLPGCFCMYRLRTPGSDKPLLISNQIIDEYSTNSVETLHEKNLLHLGEDRYLTTLTLKHFPYYKIKFNSSAKCMTNAPDQLTVLLSQRRRWINSTIHNLFELTLLPQLCGFCCFSMRFVVFIDLITTVIMPATLVYLVYLIYQLTNKDSTTSYLSLYLLAAIYGLQALIFIFKRQWQHIGWMIVYICAIPISSFLIPIYSFWHFDDFSWGNTRVVVGESGRKHVYTVDNEKFDKSSIPMRKWSDYERELMWESQSQSQYPGSDAGSKFGGPAAVVNRPGSATGNIPKTMIGYSTGASNSAYNDGSYGYNPMGVNNMTIGGGFDLMSSGRASPMQMPGAPIPNTYEMVQLDSNGMTVGQPQPYMTAMTNPSLDPRMSQVSANPFAQPAFTDTRMSAYSSVSSIPPMQMQAPVTMAPYNNPASAIQARASLADTQVSGQQLDIPLNYSASPFVSYAESTPPNTQNPASNTEQVWPSGVTDGQISTYIAEMISTADLMSITKKQVREQTMAQFGMHPDEVKARREFINQCIAQELQKRS